MHYLCEPSRSMLIIIDLQQKLMPVISDGETVLKRALILAQAAKLFAVPIIATEQQPLRLGPTVADIAAMPDRTIQKNDFDATASADLLSSLQAWRNELIVVGCEAHICVLQTVLGLLDRQWRVRLVVDAIGSRLDLNKAVAIDRARAAGADIVTSEMIIFEWLRNSDHPKFREALKLIK